MKAAIFDLDGVIVSTDIHHYHAWKLICDTEGIPFDEEINKRLRGVGRMDCVEIILEKASRAYSEREKWELAERKNEIYRANLNSLSSRDILPGVQEILKGLKAHRTKVAIGSSSKNTSLILDKIGLNAQFDAIVTGNDIKNSKPDPEVFLLAAKKLAVPPENCIVFEDATAGVQAAIHAGMKVVGVGHHLEDLEVDLKVASIDKTTPEEVLNLLSN